jgi:hypothetical protein
VAAGRRIREKKFPGAEISGEFWASADLGSRGPSGPFTSPTPCASAVALDAERRAGDMLDFMENVQHAFYDASHWNVDNSYGALNATARGTPARLPLAPSPVDTPC